MITINHLDFHYQRKKKVYSDLNLTIKGGSVYALLGLNGAGKTTLLNLISGILIPESGSCTVFGHETKLRKPEMLREIFLVGDISEFPSISIDKFCDLYAGFYPRFNDQLFNHCINEFGLQHNTSLKTLSFGDKRKVILSFALATKCQLLLFDEPTNGLDIPSKATFRKLVASSLDENQSILIATHQVRDLANLMDWIIIEHCGQMIVNEPIDRIADKLSFGLPPDQITPGNLVFKADGFNQNETVSINNTQLPSQVDIELLFNAAISNPNNLTQIFNS